MQTGCLSEFSVGVWDSAAPVWGCHSIHWVERTPRPSQLSVSPASWLQISPTILKGTTTHISFVERKCVTRKLVSVRVSDQDKLLNQSVWLQKLDRSLKFQMYNYTSRIMRKPFFFCMRNHKHSNHAANRKANQCLCFRYIDSTIPLL